MQRIVIQPILQLATHAWDIGSFDLSWLPLRIVEGISLEDVRTFLPPEQLEPYKNVLGQEDAKSIDLLQYGLVARCVEAPDIKGLYSDLSIITTCLRIIRPTREKLSTIRVVEDNGAFSITQVDHPLNLVNVSDMESLFAIRTEDALRLVELVPAMLLAMRSNAWKFRMAVQFNDSAHLQHLHWKPRFMLRCAALEALYSSKKFRGISVSKKRIRAFLGGSSPIYSSGDLPQFLDHYSDITIDFVLNKLYEVRNFVAHGEKIPDEYFSTFWRQGLQGQMSMMAVLDEAAAILVRKSLLKILSEKLFDRFEDAESVDLFFATKS